MASEWKKTIRANGIEHALQFCGDSESVLQQDDPLSIMIDRYRSDEELTIGDLETVSGGQMDTVWQQIRDRLDL